ncbi:MAG: LacI family DNA-binding transcriptional regulator [Chitinophagaceae bacterium]|nr:LacI family DNA-binding transcriptional regulator [Chitinophagaceae bacterium]
MPGEKEKKKRATIRDIADAVGIAPSSVSKALNDLPTISENMKTLVRAKARELNYKHNSNAANLRRGRSRTIGVIVPKINVAFFADIIAGIEQACFENDHRLIICQSHESFEREMQAVETLIQQNVDCVLISLSQETKTTDHLKEITNHNIQLVQFDRVDHTFGSHILVNDNREASFKAVQHLISQGYKKIAFFGGPDYLPLYKERKQGYLDAIGSAGLTIPYNFIVDNILKRAPAEVAATELLRLKFAPDAFFTVSDYAALGVLKAAERCGKKVPGDIGIIGFSNEAFTEVTSPTLSSVSQQSREMGRETAYIYFNYVLNHHDDDKAAHSLKLVIESAVIERESSVRKNKKGNKAGL